MTDHPILAHWIPVYGRRGSRVKFWLRALLVWRWRVVRGTWGTKTWTWWLVSRRLKGVEL